MRASRRTVLGLATAGIATIGATGMAFAETSPDSEPPAENVDKASTRTRRVYERRATAAGGVWNSLISISDSNGSATIAVDVNSADVVEAYSVNKIAVAVAVLDKVDRGLLQLNQRVDVTADIVVADTDGIFWLDTSFPSSVTLGHVLANLLTVSDNTAVRLCGLVCPAAELNEILRGKGFVATQVVPVANPNRFFLGTTSPAECHDLLTRLVGGTLLSAESTAFILRCLRAPAAFTDGIRRTMSSAERGRVATKAGWFADGRNEAGVIFDTDGRPVLTYALFAHGQDGADDFGATHPAVQARAHMGRAFFDIVGKLTNPQARMAAPVPSYAPYNGG